MAEVGYLPGCGIDPQTGKIISGWPHCVRRLETIFTTAFGERVMREWFGSAVPIILGRENIVPSTFVKYFSAICAAIDLWEPDFRVVQISPIRADRLGRAHFLVEGEYRPRAHLGDPTVEDVRKIAAFGGPNVRWIVRNHA